LEGAAIEEYQAVTIDHDDAYVLRLLGADPRSTCVITSSAPAHQDTEGLEDVLGDLVAERVGADETAKPGALPRERRSEIMSARARVPGLFRRLIRLDHVDLMWKTRWSPNGIELVEGEIAPTPDGWARLHVTGCGICGSDLHIYRGMKAGELTPSDYDVPGHEIAGTLVDGPPGLPDVVYVIEPWISCNGCAHCLRGRPTLCQDSQLLGINAQGGLAEYVDIPTRLLHPVPDGVSESVAAMAEPWAVAVRTIHRARLSELDQRVLILGGGTIGLLCGIAARNRAARVGITCRYPHQTDLALRFGLEPIQPDELDDWAAEHEPGVVIETVGGEAETVADAVRTAGPGGRIVVVGVFATPRPTDYFSVILKELEITGSFIYGRVRSGSEFRAAVDLMPRIADELQALQTHHFPLTNVAEAFATVDDKTSPTVKVTIGTNS
ncbi:MAG: alcohol dehydrogenase catalytic domain-containing protein, partial [Acidimicrobiia bacterium]|nr:alcohol dehydrogenase catalytic domain-containing protein [Acidimicrobiia bacterium]